MKNIMNEMFSEANEKQIHELSMFAMRKGVNDL